MGSSLKYNPGMRGDNELIDSFVVRHHELSRLIETVQENTGPSNQHLLVIGPRGSGKTTLVRRVAAEARIDPALKKLWYPILFAEESYLVSTAGEFWLEALFHLAEQTQDTRWLTAYEELQEEANEATLRDRSLAQLMDFADLKGKRILIVVENLNMLLGEQMCGSADWDLRHTLLNEPRIMFLGTATCRFDAIESTSKAWFDLLAETYLDPLEETECRTLWGEITSNQIEEHRIRPIKILTGGNPRLLRILAEFAARRSFRELMNQLIQLVDDHTEYFKSHLDHLPSMERRVFVALLDLWDPASASAISKKTRMETNKVSALLNRLMNRGVVQLHDQVGRRKYYQAAERLFNIYYLMRRRGHPANRVRLAVSFMTCFYDREDLISMTTLLAKEACILPSDQRGSHYLAYQSIVDKAPDLHLQMEIIASTPNRFFQTADLPKTIRKLSNIAKTLKQISRVEPSNISDQEILSAYQKILEINPQETTPWMVLGEKLFEIARFREAIHAFKKALNLDPLMAKAWTNLGASLSRLTPSRIDEVEYALRKAVQIEPSHPIHWCNLSAFLVKVSRFEEAKNAVQKAVELNPEDPEIWTSMATVLAEAASSSSKPEQNYQEAERALNRAISLDPQSTVAWGDLGVLLSSMPKRDQEAEEAFQRVINLNPKDGLAWAHLGNLFHRREQWKEAERALAKAVQLAPGSPKISNYTPGIWSNLGLALQRQSKFEEAAAAYRNAIEIDSSFALAWTNLGLTNHLLSKHIEAEQALTRATELAPDLAEPWMYLAELLCDLKRYEEAKKAYFKASELGIEDSIVNPRLFEISLKKGDEPEAVMNNIRGYLDASEVPPQTLNDLAEILLRGGLEQYLSEAEAWLLRAIGQGEESWYFSFNLIRVLSLLGRWTEALDKSEMVLSMATKEELAIHASTAFLTEAAAAGHGEEALQRLLTSEGYPALETLATGLQIFLGESPRRAQEILEVGRDVAKNIDERRNRKLAKGPDTPTQASG